MKDATIRVLVSAERDMRAATLESLLRATQDLHVVAGPLRSLRLLIEEHEPDVVVLASAPARATTALAGMLDPPPLIVLVDDPHAVWTEATRRAGVHAVLGHDASMEQLTVAIRAVATGLITLDPEVFRVATRAAVASEDRALTPREREILQMVSEGFSNPMIARRLGISKYTVKFHVASILGKLGVGSRTEAVTFGVRSGVISL